MVLKKTVFFILLLAVTATDINGQKKVTKEDMQQYESRYKDYVLSTQSRINRWHSKIINFGAKKRGYDPYSIRLIPIVYLFCTDKEKRMKDALNEVFNGNEIDLKYVNCGISKFHEQGKNNKNFLKNFLAKMLHEMHVNSLSLSDKDKKTLLNNPELFKKRVDQGKVNIEEYYRAVSLNLFIQFWFEKVKNSI